MLKLRDVRSSAWISFSLVSAILGPHNPTNNCVTPERLNLFHGAIHIYEKLPFSTCVLDIYISAATLLPAGGRRAPRPLFYPRAFTSEFWDDNNLVLDRP
jgi:hypothetical protein